MAYIPEFDLDDIVGILNSIAEKQAEGSKERDVIELAQIALLYTRHRRSEDDFVSYYKHFFDPSFKLKVSHEFATREEADTWLASGKAEESERVKIDGKGFMVVRLPGRLAFMVAPLPEEMDADEWKDDSE
ncbi:hypothetical protein D187_005164 [Cystobacter fuscus DSM 2262]|uniref:Uncharacterized protein n=1 Tax=Cystobacter fuscus (strain ATCC 25194 / DSM 2262 / NBRC 100088 / M29) TaxID=1242864 RepID=S9PM02_CYSF2|nr:hypothetical protein [Cystobacter fuscus]EPX64031.1 hypothetical protein D187_005164 [Cystobacter fuscus DSM 2262]